jgi:hypothetical protein
VKAGTGVLTNQKKWAENLNRVLPNAEKFYHPLCMFDLQHMMVIVHLTTIFQRLKALLKVSAYTILHEAA